MEFKGTVFILIQISCCHALRPRKWLKEDNLAVTLGIVYFKRLLASSCPSARMEQLGSHWTDFYEFWYLSTFRKSVEKFQVSLKSDKNNGYFTWRPIHSFYHISLISSWNKKCFRQTLYRKSSTHFIFNNFLFFENRAVLWDNMEKYCRAG